MGNKVLLSKINSTIKKFDFKKTGSRACVESSHKSKCGKYFIEVLSSVNAFYCVFYGFNQSYWPPSVDIVNNKDLGLIAGFLTENGLKAQQ